MLPKHIVRPVPCPATNFKTTVDIYVLTEYKLVYIYIYIYMTMRGKAEPRNHNPTLYIYRVISP